MTDTAVSVDTKAPTPPGKMPPVVHLPKPVQGVLISGFRRWFLRNALKRYGPVFAMNVPFFGRSVVVSDPALVLEKLGGHHRADRMAAQVLGTGIATAVTVKAGHRVIAAGLQFPAEHVPLAHGCSIAHAGPAYQPGATAAR